MKDKTERERVDALLYPMSPGRLEGENLERYRRGMSPQASLEDQVFYLSCRFDGHSEVISRDQGDYMDLLDRNARNVARAWRYRKASRCPLLAFNDKLKQLAEDARCSNDLIGIAVRNHFSAFGGVPAPAGEIADPDLGSVGSAPETEAENIPPAVRSGIPEWHLCCCCGTITLETQWTYWQAKDDWDDEKDKWRPSEFGEYDPMCLCPTCGWEHIDLDDGCSGFYSGTFEEMSIQRGKDLPEHGEWWANRLEEIAKGEA